MSLIKYFKKRNLEKSSEPEEKNSKKPKKLIYCIHKHHASHLHYDLRLEVDGTLKSWAIPKQPPKTKGIKRLAIQVEDHPRSYATFEGIIPEGNYGAGKVEIWDNGNFELEKKNSKEILIKINGKKLNGEYALIKTNFQRNKNSWIFFKR